MLLCVVAIVVLCPMCVLLALAVVQASVCLLLLFSFACTSGSLLWCYICPSSPSSSQILLSWRSCDSYSWLRNAFSRCFDKSFSNKGTSSLFVGTSWNIIDSQQNVMHTFFQVLVWYEQVVPLVASCRTCCSLHFRIKIWIWGVRQDMLQNMCRKK
jgi:hypothetical protein